MKTITYSEFRKRLSSVLDSVIDDHRPIVVTRSRGKRPVVVMSQEEFNSMEETAHLMSSPKNVKRLNESIAQIERGEVFKRDLIDG